MSKVLLLLVPLALALAARAEAQRDAAPAWSRVSVSAYTGVRVPYNTGFVSVYDADGPVYAATERRGGGALLGVDAALRVAGPLSLVAGGAFGAGGISSYYVDRAGAYQDSADLRVRFSEATVFARAALSLRLRSEAEPGETRPRPSTDLFAGGGIVRQFDSTHPAADFGFNGAFPLAARGLELVVGVEDYLVFWDADALSPLLADVLRPSDAPAGAELLYDTSNVLLLRAGLSLRF